MFMSGSGVIMNRVSRSGGAPFYFSSIIRTIPLAASRGILSQGL